MKIAGWLTERQIGGFLVLILAAPTAQAAATPWRDPATAQQEQSASYNGAQQAGSGSQDGKPIVDSAQPDAALPDAPEVAQSQSTSSNEQNESSQPSQSQQQSGAAPPVGTAAAPSETATGVAASRPAGAVIAPAKQRRVRTILISLGVVGASCVALGIVAGLSHASSSQPK
jgi:hypothetical protein